MHYKSKGHRKQLYQLKVKELQKKMANSKTSTDCCIVDVDEADDNLIWELIFNSQEEEYIV